MLLTTSQANYVMETVLGVANVGARICGSFVFGRGHAAVSVGVDTDCADLPVYVARDGTVEEYADATAFCTAYGFN